MRWPNSTRGARSVNIRPLWGSSLLLIVVLIGFLPACSDDSGSNKMDLTGESTAEDSGQEEDKDKQ
jgi:hypothetical protein